MRTPFDDAVLAHGATVLRVCRAVLGAHADAEDAWSETFVAALRHWPDLSDDTDVRAWLVTVAHRKAIDVTRARARRAVPVEHLPERAAPAGRDAAEDEDLYAAVRALPERQRLAVAYHHLGGLPYAEIAALIGGTPAAARRAAADGIRALRARIAQTAEGSPA